jgi:hypothetical protein
MSAGGLGSIAAAAAAQQSATAAASASKGATAEEEEDEMPELEPAEEPGPVDEGDLDPKEIEMVMDQVCIVFYLVAILSLLNYYFSDWMLPVESRYRT